MGHIGSNEGLIHTTKVECNGMKWNGFLFGHQSVCASVRTSSLFAPFHAYNTFRAYNLFHADLEEAVPFPSTPPEVCIRTYFVARVYTNME